MVREPDKMLKGLKEDWAPTFQQLSFDEKEAEEYLRDKVPLMQLIPWQVSPRDFEAYFRSAMVVAAGPDGIRVSFWKPLGEALHLLYGLLSRGRKMGNGFNNSLIALLPKKAKDGDSEK